MGYDSWLVVLLCILHILIWLMERRIFYKQNTLTHIYRSVILEGLILRPSITFYTSFNEIGGVFDTGKGGKMAYELISRETYKGYPTAREMLNSYSTSTHRSLDDVVKTMREESKDIRARLELIKEWSEQKGNRVIHRELYRSANGHGRILRRYEIAKSYIQQRVFDDSLI